MPTNQTKQLIKHIDKKEKRLERELTALRSWRESLRHELLNKHELNNKTKG